MENIGNHIESTGEINPADKEEKEVEYQVCFLKTNEQASDKTFTNEKDAKKHLEALECLDKQNFIDIPYTYYVKEVEL